MRDDFHVPTETAPAPTTPERLDFIYHRLTSMPLEGIPASAKAFAKIEPSISLGDVTAVQSFIEEALARLPKDEADDFRLRLAEASGDASPLVVELHQRVGSFLDDTFAIACYRRIFAHGLGPAIGSFARVVNAPLDSSRPAGIIVFVCRSCYNLLQREARFLRKNGYRCYLVSMAPVVPNLRSAFYDCFDQIFDGFRSYLALGLILDTLSPDIFHVQCNMWEYLMARVVIEHRRDAKVVCEFYDITSVYADREILARQIWPEIVDLDLEMECYIFQNADGMMHRYPNSIIKKLGDHYGACPPNIEIQQYPSREYIKYPTERLSDGDGQIRLVYAGGLTARLPNGRREMYPEWGHIEAWEALLAQGFLIDVYCSPFRPPEGLGFEDFHALAERQDGFRFMLGVPQDKLSETLGSYDFGLSLAEFDQMASWLGDDHFYGSVATKIYSYFEAGLPVLVNSEYGYMTEIIEGNGLGFGIHGTKIAEAGSAIHAFDRVLALERIKQFNDTHQIDHAIKRIMDLYRSI